MVNMKEHDNQSSTSPWWDGTDPDTFFPAVYRHGDDSEEGHIHDSHLDVAARTRRECDMVERVLDLPENARILDCPCGYGRHSIELARRGYRTVGVDLCPGFLDEARAAAMTVQEATRPEFIHGDMRFMPDIGPFDACLNMFLSFGFFSDEDNLRVLQQFHRVLRSGGKLLIHSDVNPDRAYAGDFIDRQTRHLRHGGILRIDEHFDPETGVLSGTWSIRTDGQVTDRNYSLLVYTHDQLLRLLQNAGFREATHRAPFSDDNDAGSNAQEVVYVATA